MNTDNQANEPLPLPATAPHTPEPERVPSCPPLPAVAHQNIFPTPPAPKTRSCRRNGKIARLPQYLRDMINSMLDDGAPYSEILKELRKEEVTLTHRHLSRWYKGGYRDWLKEQNWAAQLRLRQETFCDLRPGETPTQITQAALQLAATQVCQRLRDLTLAPNPDNASDSEALNRLLKTLCRVNRELFEMEKYHDDTKAELEQAAAFYRDAKARTDELKDEAKVLKLIQRQLHPKHYRKASAAASACDSADVADSQPDSSQST